MNILYSSKAEPETRVCVQSVSSEVIPASVVRSESGKRRKLQMRRAGVGALLTTINVPLWATGCNPGDRPRDHVKYTSKAWGWAPTVSVTTTQIHLHLGFAYVLLCV